MHRVPTVLLAVAVAASMAGPGDGLARQVPSAGTVTGTVLDDESGEPLAGAHVIIWSGDFRSGTISETDGRFELADLAAGTYVLEVSFIGFRTYVQEALDVPASGLVDVQVALVPIGVTFNPITVTGSRRPERLLDAPASVTVLEPRQLGARTTLTAAEHLKDAPGVDLVTTGLVSSRIVVRGFNDNLASSLLTLVDHRIARVPSVRLTALQLIPVSNADIDRIEVVSGPASAMYGPNAANGVVHVLTRPPFESLGTSVSLAAGGQNVLVGSIRHAGTAGDRLGFKVSAQYYSGTDYEFFDPAEREARTAAIEAGASKDTLRVGARDFDVENVALSGRLDYRIRPDMTLILNAGLTRGANIEITPTGAAQVNGALFSHVQARLLYRNLFVQAYGNIIDSGSSYFLRTGERFKDNSQLWVAQAQHVLDVGRAQRFTFGADLLRTLPRGSGTVNGRNEDDDETTETGAYVQSDTDLGGGVSLSIAGRIDYHDRLRHVSFSPRTALVIRPRPAHTLRLTFNRAFSTPKSNELFTDIVGQRDMFELGPLSSEYGFAPTTDLRVQGMKDGFHFRTGSDGRPYFRSPFSPLLGNAASDWIEFDDPSFTTVMWNVARFATVAGLADNLASRGAIDPNSVEAISTALDRVLPADVSDVHQALRVLDLEARQFFPSEGPADFDRLKVTRTETLEAGYRGLLFGGFLMGVDAYWSRIRDFVGPFVVGTPNVFLDPSSLSTALLPALKDALADPAHSTDAAALMPFDEMPLIGNRDGDPADEIAVVIATGVASAIPFGTVSPEEAFDPTAVMLMRRNFGDLSVYGIDAHLTMFMSRTVHLTAMYSWMSDNYFRNVDGISDVSLNAPRHKIGGMVQMGDPDQRLEAQFRWRVVDGYRVLSDVYSGTVQRFSVLDASLGWNFPFIDRTRVTLTVQNLTNNKHREFVDVPEIGRLAMLRLTHEL